MTTGTTSDGRLPTLRQIDIAPIRNEKNELLFALQDMLRISPHPMTVSLPGYFVVMHLDGRHSSGEIQELFFQQFRQRLPAEQIHGLVEALDEALLLDNARFEQAYAQRCRDYQAAPTRSNRERWPDAETLRSEIEQLLARGTAATVERVHGLIAPHLDYRRGAPCYADAYATLAQQPPADRYVILGTNHFGRSTSVVATRKDFETPLGLARTDRDFIERLERSLEASICEREFDHFSEHSVELQVHFLQVCAADHPFEIVPMLCPDPCGPTGTAPLDGRGVDLGVFADHLARLVGESEQRTVLIAGADLSHVGQRFGDNESTTAEFLEAVGRYDRKLLALLEQRHEEAFAADVRATSNPTRICSVGSVYALLRALPGRPCRVLSYHQAVDLEAETNVTCAALVVG